MKSKTSRPKREGGFTLMEIMVVVLILGLIAGYATPRYLASIRTAKLGQVTANYETVRTETVSAFYVPGSTETTAAKAAGQNCSSLTNPFGASSATRQPVVICGAADTYQYYTGSAWASYDGDAEGTVNLAGGEMVVDYQTSNQITVTAYDDTPAAMTIGGDTGTSITDPKL